MATDNSQSRIKWEGDSRDEIRSWPPSARENIGGDLRRLQDYEEPLDSKSMGKSLPGVHELRDQDKDFWYCFKKKTNQTAKADLDKAEARLRAVKARNDEPFQKEKKSA